MKHSYLIPLLLLGTSTAALAQSNGGPGAPPSPFNLDGSSAYYSGGGVLIPQNVLGGSKGPGSLNVDSLYVQGEPVLTSGGTTLNAVALSPSNVKVNNVALSSSGQFIMDSTLIVNGDVVFLPNQNNPIENGTWVYVLATNSLVRPPDYAAGATVRQPLYVNIGPGGQTYGDSTWNLSNPLTAIVGTTPTAWVSTSNGNGVLPSNYFYAGPWQPYSGPKPATSRLLAPQDQPKFTPSTSSSSYVPLSPYLCLTRYGKMSQYNIASSPWSETVAFNNMLAEHVECEVDRAVYIRSQITGQLTNRRIIFAGEGYGGAVKIFLCTSTASAQSIFDLSNVKNCVFEGDLFMKYMVPAVAGTRAVRAQSGGVTNFKAGRICAENVDNTFAITAGLTVSDVMIGTLGNNNPAAAAANIASGVLGMNTLTVNRIEMLEALQTINPPANATYTNLRAPGTTIYAGTQAANVVITLATSNMAEGSIIRFIHNATGGFTITVGGVALTNGQSVAFMAHTGAWVRIS